MTPGKLLAHFERIADAPDAIPRLRRFVLDLAVRGKLVDQDPKDEPASELLARIQAEKTRLAKAGQLRPEKSPLPIIGEMDLLPKGWAVCRWNRIALKIGDIDHKMPDTDPHGVPYVSPKDFKPNNTIDFDRAKRVSRTDYLRLAAKIKPDKGDLIYPRYGTIGENRLVVEQREFLASYSCAVIKTMSGFIDPLFQYFFSLSDYCRSQAKAAENKTTQANVGIASIQQYLVPLPPLAEQHRIVAKVDELMALCDQLEAAQKSREATRDRLSTSSLARINAPDPDPVIFSDHARFALENLPALTARPDQIKQLRQTILNLAVRGKLVDQDPNDQPAEATLVRNDNNRIITSKLDRRADVERQELLVPEARWKAPRSWSWRGLADLALFIDYRGKTPTKIEAGVRLITAKNVRVGRIDLFPEEFIAEDAYATWMTRGIPLQGDVLFTTEAPMGNAAVVNIQERFALAQRVINFRLYGAVIPDFIVLQILSDPFKAILEKTATGLTAKGIKAAKLKRLPIAIPPLAEQKRIVAKVDELMAICDRLEAQLTVTRTENARLMEAVLHEALAPEGAESTH